MKQRFEEFLDSLIIAHRIEVPESKCTWSEKRRASLLMKKNCLKLRRRLRRFLGRRKK